MNSNTNDRSGPSLERPQAPSKPVDPATRLSDLLAQSLEELTRPFDAPKPGAAAPAQPARLEPTVRVPAPAPMPVPAVPREEAPAPEPAAEPTSDEVRRDADRALAELEAELFAAAKQVDREHAAAEADESPPEPEHPGPVDLDQTAPHLVAEPAERHEDDHGSPLDLMAAVRPAPAEEATPATDADAANVIAKVRRLMLVSMAITLVAVGSVFSFIGYRMFKGDGTAAKTADKLPEKSAIPTDITLSLPRNARVVQSAVANDQLIMTLEIDGKLEVRTFDVKTLQPVGRLNFSSTP